MYTTDNGPTIPPKVLVVDDEWSMMNTLEAVFKRDGYEVVTCADGQEATRQILQEGPFDVAILDIVMPKMDGIEVIKKIRKEGSVTPVIFVSGRIAESERVRGITLGADDYVCKPFSTREILARAAAVRRRQPLVNTMPKRIRVGGVEADFESRSAFRGDEPVHFAPMEWKVLRYMAHRRGKAISREEFNVHVLRIPAHVETRTIDRHVYSMRCKIDENPRKPRHVLAVPRIGYRLNDFEVLA